MKRPSTKNGLLNLCLMETKRKSAKFKAGMVLSLLRGESVEAVLSVDGLKAVVVGGTRPELMGILRRSYSKDELTARVFFTGKVKQIKTPQYIRQCFMSLVFYKNTSPNNWYCEPNRLFQNLINGNPVVVGNNPPMKELVSKYDIGVVADTDGSDMTAIRAGIHTLCDNYSTYKQNLIRIKDSLLWSKQDSILGEITNRMLEAK